MYSCLSHVDAGEDFFFLMELQDQEIAMNGKRRETGSQIIREMYIIGVWSLSR